MSIPHGIRTLGVLGAGQMGLGIAFVSALRAKVPVLLHDRSTDQVTKGLALMDKLLAKDVAKGRITSDIAKDARGLVTGCANVDMVVESIFASFAKELRPDAILASNTSSISITKIAAARSRKAPALRASRERRARGVWSVAGLHFFNPVPVMKLVELISALQTTPETLDRARSFAVACGKGRSGFVSNALLMPFINEAIMCLEKGTATRDDNRHNAEAGDEPPQGPLQLGAIGLDTCLAIQQTLTRPSVLLERMVDAQWYGRKNGKGFYEYTD
ncbi:hypothetical protein B0H14DRAFT_3055383 [Mycena olivaceomarginata]|nr:hypothetical protein B0H14DRAFT_3055383 [Mycena olivaceomarginata]